MFEEIPETPYGFNKRIRFIYGEVAQRLDNVEDKSKVRILDIGCGTGEFITIPLGFLGVSVLGIDTHLLSIEHARRGNTFGNVQFECISLDELASQHFDFIICSEVLEHLSEPIKMLKLIKKTLKHDGVCIITIPNGYSLKEIEVRIYNALCNLRFFAFLRRLLIGLLRKIRRKERIRDTLNLESPHVQFFLQRHLKALLEKCELSIIKRENRRFLDGVLVKRILSLSRVSTNWNVSVANKIPSPLVSSWMFVIAHKKSNC